VKTGTRKMKGTILKMKGRGENVAGEDVEDKQRA
jgi:hypothetical protein